MSSKRRDTPLYQQLAEKLEKQIEAGIWKPGDQLPSENALKIESNLGHASIKRAIAELAKKGLVYSLQGKGTFVAEPQIGNGLFRLTSFTEDMKSRGLEPHSRLVELQIISADDGIAKKLSVKVGDKVMLICRLRMVNLSPIILETSYLPYELCHQILEENLSTCSLYQLLSDKCGIVLRNAKDTLEPILVDEKKAELLDVPLGSQAIQMERLSFSYDGKPIEFCTAVIRGDKCRFYFDLVNSLQK